MKKILLNMRGLSSFSALAVAALMSQSCGSNSSGSSTGLALSQAGTTPTPTSTTGTGTTGFGQCELGNGQIYTLPTVNGPVQVCRYQTAWQYFDVEAESITLTASPLTASGGELTNIQVSAGDTLYVSAVGHYTQTGGVCDLNNGGGDISVLGNSNKSQDPTINPANGLNDGLWFVFEDEDANYSTPVNATAQYVSSSSGYQTIIVPSTVLGSAQLVLGYNAEGAVAGSEGTIGCGDMGMWYSILSCVDENGNTYTCQ